MVPQSVGQVARRLALEPRRPCAKSASTGSGGSRVLRWKC
jgi:hypothetical protein